MSIAKNSVPQTFAPGQLQPTSRAKGQAATSKAGGDAERLRRVQQVAHWMDASMSVPGTPIRFGLDSAIGLIPGLGDISTAAISGWILHQAHRSGVPKRKLARMTANIAVDLAIGAIPLVGDLFDVYWKSNLRNARLLEKHLTEKMTTAQS